MAEQQSGVLLQLRQLLDTHAAKNLTDGQLLAQFAAERDEAAFAALMQRHAPLVYGVCRHVLGHEHDAEDAFQGTFLVLARKARSIRSHNSVAGWLHGVAYRVALKARQSAARRREREMQSAQPEIARPSSEEAWRELQGILDEELQRLKEKYRTPFVLCVLQGKSKAEAARELDWKEGTVSSRLAQARTVLQKRLARRGVTLSAVLCGLEVAKEGASAAVPTLLFAQTLRAASAFVAGQAVSGAANAVALAEGVLKSMAATRFKISAAVLIALLLASTATALYFRPPPDTPPPQLPVALPQPAPKDQPENWGSGAQMLVHGEIIGPDGQPVPGAHVAVFSDEEFQPGDPGIEVFSRRRVLGTGKANAQGRFELSVRRATPDRDSDVLCLARGGDGQAVAWQRLRTLGDIDAVNLKLETGQQVRGRLVDESGAPVAGVKLRVSGFDRKAGASPRLSMEEDLGIEAWPPSVVTDADGTFVLTGLLPRSTVYLETLDDKTGPQWLSVQTDATGHVDVGALKLTPPRVLEGTVIDKDSGVPCANAFVQVSMYGAGVGGRRLIVSATTDNAGRFAVKPYFGAKLRIMARGAPGTPQIVAFQNFNWPPNSQRESVQIFMPSGVLVTGQVFEEGTERPLAGVRVQYRPMSGKNWISLHGRESGTLLVLWPYLASATDAQGRFQIAVLPGLGHLLLRAPGHDYLAIEVSERELIEGVPGGSRSHFPNAKILLDLKSGAPPLPVTAKLRRGVTVQGRVETANGAPVPTAYLLTPTFRGAGWESHCEFLPVKNSRFELPGCDPEKSVPVWFWDAKSLQGAMKLISAKDDDVTVRLAPFVTATLRFVDSKGNVVRKLRPEINLVVRPGIDALEARNNNGLTELTMGVDFQSYKEDPQSGVITLKALIPDASYRVQVYHNRETVSRLFSVSAGKAEHLGDIVVPDPPPKPPKKK
ncbi:MAG: sigma-70 family RNA polymerase sigma factor [Gemmataceae bacterium]|nr:sigma-70 family RNA polymerase sigma factor [Gemmataceae bacterium]